MRKFFAIGLLLLSTGAYAQQRSAVPSDKAGNILNGSPELANQLPEPQVATDTVGALLGAATSALQAGRTGEAQEALERAESRALDRSVPYDDYRQAITDPLVTEISEARNALGTNDITGALRYIQAAQAQAKLP